MPDIIAHRLHNQQLIDPICSTPAELVAWMGAVQAQDYLVAKWSLGQRLAGAPTDTFIEQAFNRGEVLRTHAMRPTWHFLAPEDIRWVLELTSPRVHAGNAFMYRKSEVDASLAARSQDVMVQALQGGRQLTRSELAGALAQAGIQAAGQRLAYIVMWAELDGLICSGPRRGKQFTYMLLAERSPQARSLPREEALAELTRRYFTSHGPAQVQDFAWWSGLTVAEVKEGLELARPHLEQEAIEGKTYWFAPPASSPVLPASPSALLVQLLDEYIVAYKDRSALIDGRYAGQITESSYFNITLIDGRASGSWRRTVTKSAVQIESAPFRPFTPAEQAAFERAARGFGRFLELPVEFV